MRARIQRWPVVRLGEIAEFRNGINYNTTNFGTGLKVINVKDFGDRLVADFDGLEEVNPEGILRDECLLREGDILFVRSNGNRDLIGRSMIVRGVSEGVTHSAFSIKVRFTAKDILPRFFAYLFRTDIIRKELSNRGGGTNISNLNQGILNDLEVAKPPLPTQEKITAILSAYDDLIENNTRRIAVLEEMAQSLYCEWFVHFRFPGYEQARFIEKEQRRVPEGWALTKLRDLCQSLNYGYTASANSEQIGPKFLRITDIVPGQIDWDRVPYCDIADEDTDKYSLKEGDIVVARTGATTGYAKRLNKRHPPTFFASYLVRMRLLPSVGKHMIGLYVESDEYKRFITSQLGGAAQPQANAQVLASKDLFVPPVPIIKQFDTLVQPLADQKEILSIKNRNLRRTRDLLLPKLISGELDLDIDTGDPIVEVTT